MAITINTNVSALTAQRYLGRSATASQVSLSKLSSGSRVPTAKEDAAALSIGNGLQLDAAALRAAQVNAQQGASVLQIADGAFSQITDILTRMKSLATTAQSDQISNAERTYLDNEFQALQSEINRIAASTEFNGNILLGGSTTVILDTATVGGNVDTAAGFVGYTFNESLVTAGDQFDIFYDDSEGNLMVTNVTTGVSQTLHLADVGQTVVSAGELETFNFNNVGITVQLNDQFNGGNAVNAGADIGTVSGTAATEQVNAVAGTATSAFSMDVQVGIGATANDRINIGINLGNYQDLVGAGVTLQNITSKVNAQGATAQIDLALTSVNTARAELGSTLNRLEFAANNLAISIENTEAARSTLIDVDVAMEITEFTSKQVLIQSGVSMLAQANQQPALLLRLLQ